MEQLLFLMAAAADSAPSSTPEGYVDLQLLYWIVGGMSAAIVAMAGALVFGARYFANYVNKVSAEKDTIRENFEAKWTRFLERRLDDEKLDIAARTEQTKVLDELKKSVDTMTNEVHDLGDAVDDMNRDDPGTSRSRRRNRT